MFLRPTESLTVFLQQLGRGLRLSPETNKECLTVLDFIGQANKLYQFEEKFSALLPDNRRGVTKAVEDGFPFLPKGCYIQLERKASEYILKNIAQSFGRKTGIIAHIRELAFDMPEGFCLADFLNKHHLDIRSIHNKYSFARLCVEAGIRRDFIEPDEKELTKALQRVSQMDSQRWIRFILEVLHAGDTFNPDVANALEDRMLSMFQITLWPDSFRTNRFASHKDWIDRLGSNPVLLSEIVETLEWQLEHIDFVDGSVDFGFDCPLDLHCSYTRDQIFVAMDVKDPSTIRQGVRYVPEHKTDVFINTLNKAEKDYSPTTMYEDYSISDRRFHWQSQSTTSEASPTGQRYIHHAELGSRVALFVREFKEDRFGITDTYCFLGLVDYESHVGERPMSIIWHLREPIPARYLPKTNKLAS